MNRYNGIKSRCYELITYLSRNEEIESRNNEISRNYEEIKAVVTG